MYSKVDGSTKRGFAKTSSRGGSLLCPGQRYAIPSSPFWLKTLLQDVGRKRTLHRSAVVDVMSAPILSDLWACPNNLLHLLRKSCNSYSNTTSLVLFSRRARSMFSRMGSTRLAEKGAKAPSQFHPGFSSRVVSCGPRELRAVMSMSAAPREVLRRDCWPRSATTLLGSMPRFLFRPSIPFRGLEVAPVVGQGSAGRVPAPLHTLHWGCSSFSFLPGLSKTMIWTGGRSSHTLLTGSKC